MTSQKKSNRSLLDKPTPTNSNPIREIEMALEELKRNSVIMSGLIQKKVDTNRFPDWRYNLFSSTSYLNADNFPDWFRSDDDPFKKKYRDRIEFPPTPSMIEEMQERSGFKAENGMDSAANLTSLKMDESVRFIEKKLSHIKHNQEKFFRIPFKMPNELRTSVKQYLAYFNEYVETTKGKKIHFEVRLSDDGLDLEILNQDEKHVEEIKIYLEEYLGFIQKNIKDVEPIIETNLSEEQKDLLIISLKHDIEQFKFKLELKNVEIRFLKSSVSDLLLTLKDIKSPQPMIGHVENIHGDFTKGDCYEVGQASMVGPNAHQLNYKQAWDELAPQTDLLNLAKELKQIRLAMRKDDDPETDLALPEIAKAEISAKENDGPTMLKFLKGAGESVLPWAEKISTGLATAAIKSALGI